MYSSGILSCGKIIALHSFESRQPVTIYNPHRGLINGLNINHTNKVIASCGQDGRIVLVAAEQPQKIHFQQAFNTQRERTLSVNCCAFSSTSKYLAAGSADSIVKVWDLKEKETKKAPLQIKSHIGAITSLAWIKSYQKNSSAGEILASSSSIGDIYLHSLKNNAVVETMSSKSQEGINAIRISESEEHCRMAACTNAGSVLIWDLNSSQKEGGLMCTFNNSTKASTTCLSFSSFNPVLLVTCSVDENLIFYDIHEKKSVKTISTEEPLTAVNFHSDGHTLVAGGMYGGLFVYDLRNPHKPKEKLIGHQTTIKCLEFFKERDQKQPSQFANSRSSKSSSTHSQNLASNNLVTTNLATTNLASNLASNIQSKNGNNFQIPVAFHQQQKTNNREVLKPQEIKVNNYTNSINPTNSMKTSNNEFSNKEVISKEAISKEIISKELMNKDKKGSELNHHNMKNDNNSLKLTSTGQDVLRNAQVQKLQEKEGTGSLATNNMETDIHNKKIKQISKNNYATNVNASTTHTNVNASNAHSFNSYSQNNSQILPNTNNHYVSSKQWKEEMLLMEKRIKLEVNQMAERLNMELIRQFQISQQDNKRTIEDMIFKDKKKDQKIRLLQSQIKRLKHQTY